MSMTRIEIVHMHAERLAKAAGWERLPDGGVGREARAEELRLSGQGAGYVWADSWDGAVERDFLDDDLFDEDFD